MAFACSRALLSCLAIAHTSRRSVAASASMELGRAGPTNPVKVAVAQMTSTGDREANFRTVEALAQQAAAQGCAVLFLPEAFGFVGSSPTQSLAVGEPLTGPAMTRLRGLARSLSLWLSLGGFHETGPDPQHLFNTHCIVDSSGELVAVYRKVHLFDVDVPNGPVLMESSYAAPGDRLVACDSPAGRLGLSTCYDLRFPELYQRLVFDMGAQILLVPSAFTVATGRAHWEVLLRARAVETQCYVIAAAQAGRHNEKRESYGHSLIVDSWGAVVGRLEDPLATGIATAEIDLAALQQIRQRMPIAEHRLKGQAYLRRGEERGKAAAADGVS